MPDITMCPGSVGVIVCPRRSTCYRYTAIPSEYQSYFMGLPMNSDKTCGYFWDDNDYRKHNRVVTHDIPNDTRDRESV